MSHGRKLGIIGLGYIGLPDAVVFAVAHKDYIAGGWPLIEAERNRSVAALTFKRGREIDG